MIVHRMDSTDPIWWNGIVNEQHHGLAYDITGLSVIDIGAHIGAFSWLALHRGAALVHGYEMCEDYWRCSLINTAEFGRRSSMRRRIVWEDRETPLFMLPGNDSVHIGSNAPVIGLVTLDDTILRMQEATGRESVGLVKIDIEGAEFPVIYASKFLGNVENIIIEYHEGCCDRADIPVFGDPDRATGAALNAYLYEHGFATDIDMEARADQGLGTIHAWRNRPEIAFAL